MAENPKIACGRLILVLATGMLGGCASMSDFAGVPHAGHQPNGGYVLLASEQGLDCRRLSAEVEQGLNDMRASKARVDAERAATPTTMASVYGRMFGGENGGLKSVAAYKASDARVRALNAQLQSKGCHYVDVDARIMAFNLAPLSSPNSATGLAHEEKAGGVVTASIPSTPKVYYPPSSSSADMQAELEQLNQIRSTSR